MEIKIVIDEKRLADLGRRFVTSRRAKALTVLGLTLTPLLVYAATKPHTFTDGATISAGEVNKNFDTLFQAVTDLETRPPRPIIWSGGCNAHGTASGWNKYCTNSTDFNTASSYLTAGSDGTFVVKVAGYYRINYWGLTLGNGYTHVNIVKNGNGIAYNHNYDTDGGWRTADMDQLWPMNAGDTFYVQVHNPGSYAFHSWNAKGEHSRLQVSYEGTL